MTKADFIDRVASKSGLSKRDATKAVDAFLDSITEALRRDEAVSFTGFGKFSPQQRKERQGVNPRTGEQRHDPRRPCAEVLRRQRAQAGAQERLAPLAPPSALCLRGPPQCGPRRVRQLVCEHTFAILERCNSRSMPPIASSSCSRSAEARSRRRRRRPSSSHSTSTGSAAGALSRAGCRRRRRPTRLARVVRRPGRRGRPKTLPLEAARFVVVDLETTGLRPGESRICEIGAVRIEALAAAATFETLVDPGVPLPPIVSSLTGIGDEDLASAPGAADAVRSFLAFAGDAVLVAHNARFDVAFLDREVERLTGRRLAAPVLDTVGLARRLLAGRVPRVASRRSPTSSARRRSRAIARCPTRRRPPRS